jgi:hypothetical protein
MHALAVTTVDVDESSSNKPVHPRTSGGESREPEACNHPQRAQTLDELEDGRYARSCQCGVVLDYWRDEQAMEAGLEQLAPTWGVSVEAVRTELAIDT